MTMDSSGDISASQSTSITASTLPTNTSSSTASTPSSPSSVTNDAAAVFVPSTAPDELSSLINAMKDAATMARKIRATGDAGLKAQYQTQLTNDVNTIKGLVYNSSSSNGDYIIGNQACQGSIGDCYLLTGLNGAALNGDNTIKDAIKNDVQVNDNGTISVNFQRQVFKDGTWQSVTTTTKVTAGGLSQIQNRNYYVHNAEAFANVVERGYAQFRVATHQVHAPVIRGNNAGLTSYFLNSMTGHAVYQQSVSLSNDSDLDTALQQANSGGKYILSADTKSSVASGYVPNHAYLIKSYDSNTQTLTLVNPWDNSTTKQVSWNDFKANFTMIDGIDKTA